MTRLARRGAVTLRWIVGALVIGGGLVHARGRERLGGRAAACEAAGNRTACTDEASASRRAAAGSRRDRLALVARRADDGAVGRRSEQQQRRRLLRGAERQERLAHGNRSERSSERPERSDPFGWHALCANPAEETEEAGDATPAAGATTSPSVQPPPVRGGCHHKPLLSPHLVPLDVMTVALVFCVAALALASGIGGGGIYVPVRAAPAAAPAAAPTASAAASAACLG